MRSIRPLVSASLVMMSAFGMYAGFGAGCAAIIDVKELRAPEDGGADAPAADACASTGATNLVLTPRGLRSALDDTDVYFTRADPPRSSAILRCSKCGCTEPTELVTGLDTPGAIAVDDRWVYWTDTTLTGSVSRVDKKDPTKREDITGQPSPVAVTVDADFVYWTVIGGGADPLAGAGVWRADRADLGNRVRLARADTSSEIVPYAIAVDASHVYYTVAPDLNDSDPDQPCLVATDGGARIDRGGVRRVKRDGPADQRPETIARNQPCPVSIALGDDAVYWTNLGFEGTPLPGNVWTATKAGGTSTARLLADAPGRPTSIGFHDGILVWSLPGAQRIEACNASACDVKTIASGQGNPTGVSVDRTGIYWLAFGTGAQTFTDGALRRAPLP